MSQFAKLFERDGQQVLVTLGEDDPSIVFKFRDDAADFYVAPSIGFKVKDDSDDAREEAWKKAEDTFAKVTQEVAFSMRTKTLRELGMEVAS